MKNGSKYGKTTILIIEDEKPIVDILTYGLVKEGYEVKSCYNGSDGLNLLKEFQPSIVLLDWMLPDLNGPDVCRLISEQFNIPIIMLTAKANMEDKLYGLQVGADDYITKPFDLREVVARIKIILRRMQHSVPPEKNQFEFNGEISEEGRTVKRNGEYVELTPKEFDLLLYFIKHPKHVFTREKLLEELWDYSYMGDTRTVDIHVQRLRKKLGLDQELVTVFGVGYKYVPA